MAWLAALGSGAAAGGAAGGGSLGATLGAGGAGLSSLGATGAGSALTSAAPTLGAINELGKPSSSMPQMQPGGIPQLPQPSRAGLAGGLPGTKNSGIDIQALLALLRQGGFGG